MKPLVIIRPEPGAAASLAAARTMGLNAHAFPLFTVSPVPWQAPDPAGFDALLIGSANALRHGGTALTAYRSLPVYGVGQTTAHAARQGGFSVAATGAGGLQDLMGQLAPGHRALLRLSGHQRVTLEPPPGVRVHDVIVYASRPQTMPTDLAKLLAEPVVVALHSAEAARYFTQCCAEQEIDRSRVALAAIGPRVVEAAGRGWHSIVAADQPSDAALLALARQMCQ